MPKRPTQLQEQSQRQQQETDPSSVASSSSSSSCDDCGSIGCKCMFVDARDTQDDDDDNNETHLLSSKTLTFPDSLDYEHMEEGRQCLLPTTTNSSSESVASRTPRAVTKTIGNLGSMAIAVNALASPAILQLPATYQESGFIPTTVTLIVVGLLSCLCSLHMANVVSKVPYNRNYEQMVEFSEPFRVFWGKRAFILTQVVFFMCTVCLNTAGIVDSSQVVDTFLGHSALGSVGFRFHPTPVERVSWKHGPCTRELVREGRCDPFGDDDDFYGNLILTAGYMIAALVLVPVCLLDLKENVACQIFGFAVLCLNSVQFVGSFIAYGINLDYLPLWGDRFERMIGVILFNFSLVVAIPAWLHDKKEEVSVKKIVYGSSFLATVLYILVGTFGALAIPNVNSNVLEPMVSGAFGNLMRISASFFAFVNIGLDIPLFSVLARYNLVNSGLCSRRLANVFVVYIPWGVSWMFYQGDAIEQLLSWGGVLFTSVVAFILPLSLALYMLLFRPECEGAIDVHGKIVTSRRANIVALSFLLLGGSSAVAFALIGLL